MTATVATAMREIRAERAKVSQLLGGNPTLCGQKVSQLLGGKPTPCGQKVSQLLVAKVGMG